MLARIFWRSKLVGPRCSCGLSKEQVRSQWWSSLATHETHINYPTPISRATKVRKSVYNPKIAQRSLKSRSALPSFETCLWVDLQSQILNMSGDHVCPLMQRVRVIKAGVNKIVWHGEFFASMPWGTIYSYGSTSCTCLEIWKEYFIAAAVSTSMFPCRSHWIESLSACTAWQLMMPWTGFEALAVRYRTLVSAFRVWCWAPLMLICLSSWMN